MRIAVNAASAQVGGAVTYLRNVIPALRSAIDSNGGGTIILWTPATAVRGADMTGVERRTTGSERSGTAVGNARRLWFDQWELPRLLSQEGTDALFSSANFGTLRSPVRQVLLVRNSLFFDPMAMDRIKSRAVRARLIAQRMLTVRSIRAADVVLFPTLAMRDLVAPYVGGSNLGWRVTPYGVRHDLFHIGRKRQAATERVDLLNVSLYCDQKNLGTLLAAMKNLQARSRGRHRLRVTAGFRSFQPGPWYPNLQAEREAFLLLEQEGVVSDVDSQAYGSLPALYQASDIFVFPSYTESFGHPLLEAMASGLPVVAADVPVNREMCADAAVYFAPFDVHDCADSIARVADDPDLAERMRVAGLARAQCFTWESHAASLWKALQGGQE